MPGFDKIRSMLIKQRSKPEHSRKIGHKDGCKGVSENTQPLQEGNAMNTGLERIKRSEERRVGKECS